MKRPILLLAALVLGAAPAAAQAPQKSPQATNQQASACRNETERFAATFTAPDRAGRGADQAAPGARAGTSLSDEDRQQMRRRLDEARAAADRGDAEECLRNLREARTAARQAGFGGPGSSATSSRGETGRGSGSLNTDTAGSRPPG